MARKTEPSGALWATLTAAAKVPPAEMPQKMPSWRARSRAASRASTSVTSTASSKMLRLKTAGTKSGVQPWILWGCHSPLVTRAAPAGSVKTMRMPGRAAFNISPAPVMVPPVPSPLTK